MELHEFGIGVTTVCPGWIRTPMTAALHCRRAGGDGGGAGGAGDRSGDPRSAGRSSHFRRGWLWQLRLLRYLPRPISDWIVRRSIAQADRCCRRREPNRARMAIQQRDVTMESLFRYVAPPSSCGYLPEQVWSLEYEYVAEMTAAEYLQRMIEGWRRFGNRLFRPRVPACRACQALRVRAAEFRPDRSQRRVRKANEGECRCGIGQPASPAQAGVVRPISTTIRAVAKGWPEHAPRDAGSYVDSFVDNPFRWRNGATTARTGSSASATWTIWPRAPRDLASQGSEGLSAIYFIYDPEERRRSPGTWNVLCLIEEASGAACLTCTWASMSRAVRRWNTSRISFPTRFAGQTAYGGRFGSDASVGDLLHRLQRAAIQEIARHQLEAPPDHRLVQPVFRAREVVEADPVPQHHVLVLHRFAVGVLRQRLQAPIACRRRDRGNSFGLYEGDPQVGLGRLLGQLAAEDARVPRQQLVRPRMTQRSSSICC